MREYHIEEADNGFVLRHWDEDDGVIHKDQYVFGTTAALIDWLKTALTAPMIGKAK